jgi:uncharacterized OB-fold protein
MDWMQSSRRGRVYAITTVRISVREELKPPYGVALIELDEGPRLVTTTAELNYEIGDMGTLTWSERREGFPVLIFRKEDAGVSGR